MPTDPGELQRKAKAFVRELVALDGPALARQVEALARLGHAEIAAAADCTGRSAQHSTTPADAVGTQLDRLKAIVTSLDPGEKPPSGLWQRMFGGKQTGSASSDYFQRYERAQDEIADVLRRMAGGRDDLVRANIAIATRQAQFDAAIDGLDRMGGLAQSLDAMIEAAAREIHVTDPAKAQLLRLDAVDSVRRRAQDILTQLTIVTQARLALDIIAQNNLKLVDGIDRATTATVAALRVAVVAADAMTHQRLVLDRIAKVNEVAAHPNVDPAAQHDALQKAFVDVHQSIDALDDVRARSPGLPTS